MRSGGAARSPWLEPCSKASTVGAARRTRLPRGKRKSGSSDCRTASIAPRRRLCGRRDLPGGFGSDPVATRRPGGMMIDDTDRDSAPLSRVSLDDARSVTSRIVALVEAGGLDADTAVAITDRFL